MDPTLGLLILALVAGGGAFACIRIASEYQRFAVFVLGRFAGLRGPGLIFRLPCGGSRWIRISVGDFGELVGPHVGRFSGVDMPASYEGNIRPGGSVRIAGFTSDEVLVEADPTHVRKITCERCGHEMAI